MILMTSAIIAAAVWTTAMTAIASMTAMVIVTDIAAIGAFPTAITIAATLNTQPVTAIMIMTGKMIMLTMMTTTQASTTRAWLTRMTLGKTGPVTGTWGVIASHIGPRTQIAIATPVSPRTQIAIATPVNPRMRIVIATATGPRMRIVIARRTGLRKRTDIASRTGLRIMTCAPTSISIAALSGRVMIGASAMSGATALPMNIARTGSITTVMTIMGMKAMPSHSYPSPDLRRRLLNKPSIPTIREVTVHQVIVRSNRLV
jgi:hypothetical protein